MLNKLIDYFLLEPKRIISLGQFLSPAGATFLMAGVFGRLATTAVSVTATLGSQPANVKTLAEIYPFIPTWWIPESLIGVLISLMLIGIGLWLIQVGKQLVRIMNF